jgi:branched-chain amino acid transport system permease protein
VKRFIPAAIVAALAFILPPLANLTKTSYLMTQLTMSAYYALASLGLCALMGYAGQINMGQAGFFAIGGYASAFISKMNLSAFASSAPVKALGALGLLSSGHDSYGTAFLSPSPWLSCCLAVCLAVAVAALIGMPVLRLRGHYLAMATLAFGIVVEKVVRGTTALGGAGRAFERARFHRPPRLGDHGRPRGSGGQFHDLLARPGPRAFPSC